MEIRFIHGDILDVDSAAWVLGICQDVTPSGAARAIDEKLGGAVTEFTSRRMFHGGAGEIFMLPTSRHPVPVDTIVFAGLGPFDRLTAEVQRFVAENVVRTLIRARIDEFACLLLGAHSGRDVASTLEAMLDGFHRGIRDAGGEGRLHRISICEIDAERYAEMRRSAPEERVRNSAGSELARQPASEACMKELAAPDPVYLLVRSESASPDLTLHASLLTAGDKATVVTGRREISRRLLELHLAKLDGLGIDFDPRRALYRFGATLSRMVLPENVVSLLGEMADRHLVIVQDRDSSRIPWETLAVPLPAGKRWTLPAVAAGISRRYLAAGMPVAKWLEHRRREKTLNVLLIADPAGDLPSAGAEAHRIEVIAYDHKDLVLTILRKEKATKRALIERLESGEFDLLHYAGHGYFDEENPEFSGIVCAGKELLTGKELSELGNFPSVVFLNACTAARIRGAAPLRPAYRGRESTVSLAEAFLRGGVANYIGTYWPVADDSAAAFAATFYKHILDGRSLCDALLAARHRLQRLESIDWADYVHYGDWQFKPKPRTSSE